MILAQPILAVLLIALVALYFVKLRSRSSDTFLVLVCFGVSALLVFRPTVATRLAHFVGIGRGVDLIFYLTIPSLALGLLLLFARTRDLNLKLTAAIRELALSNAHVPNESDRK